MNGTGAKLLAVVAVVALMPGAAGGSCGCIAFTAQLPVQLRAGLSPASSAASRDPTRLSRPSPIALRAGLGDAVKGLWPFNRKKDNDEQYKDRKDVWNSLVTLDQFTGGELQVLTNALTATGLWKSLASEGDKKQPPVTLFAAVNSAFDRLPPDCLLADCVAAIADESKPTPPALLAELRTSLLGSIADGRHSVSSLDGKKTGITTRSGRTLDLDLTPGTRASDFSDYKLDMELRRKVKICSASALVSVDIQCCNGVIHVVDKLPDGSEPIVRLALAPAGSPPKSVTEAEANNVQQQLFKARARTRELESQLESLKPLVADKKLTRESIKELVDTYTRLAADYQAYKARAEEDLSKATQAAATSLLGSLFKVLDTFELAQAGLKPGMLPPSPFVGAPTLDSQRLVRRGGVAEFQLTTYVY
jgi:hypothetical protein